MRIRVTFLDTCGRFLPSSVGSILFTHSVEQEKSCKVSQLWDLGYASENKEEAAMLALLKAKPILHLTAWW